MKNILRIVALTTALMALAASASAQRYTGGLSSGTIGGGEGGAAMDFKPYSGSYLPRSEGPLMKEKDEQVRDMIKNGFGDCDLVHQVVKDNADKASSEKFDTAVNNAEGRNPGLTESYRRDGYNADAEGWEGFCHLWAPAGLDPASGFIVSMDKIYANVPFGIGDLRELVTYNYPRASTKFFGTRNYDKDKPRKDASEELDAMDMLNIFTNYVGPGKPGVVLDVDPGYMVWNQPVYSYKTESKQLYGAAARGAPRGGKAYTVTLTAEYGLEGHYGYRGDMISSTKTWKMTVYTDENGNVVRAKWPSGGRSARGDEIPDFAWVPEIKRTSANFDRLKKIATEGVSVKDIEAFCKGMQGLTAGSFDAAKGKELADLLNKICPVLDQNELNDYIRKTAERAGIDYTVLDAALSDGNVG